MARCGCGMHAIARIVTLSATLLGVAVARPLAGQRPASPGDRWVVCYNDTPDPFSLAAYDVVVLDLLLPKLDGIGVLEKLRADPARDARLMAELQPLLTAWLRTPRPLDAEREQFGWLLEELRVSLFAQALKTPVPVSAKRLAKLWQSIRR